MDITIAHTRPYTTLTSHYWVYVICKHLVMRLKYFKGQILPWGYMALGDLLIPDWILIDIGSGPALCVTHWM